MNKLKKAIVLVMIISIVIINNYSFVQAIETNQIQENISTKLSDEEKNTLQNNTINDDTEVDILKDIDANIVDNQNAENEQILNSVVKEDEKLPQNKIIDNNEQAQINEILDNEVEEENNVQKEDIVLSIPNEEKIDKNDELPIEIIEPKNNLTQQQGNSVLNIMGIGNIEEGIYEIEVGLNSGKVLEVRDGATYSGANVQIFSRNKAMCQRVEIKNLGQGYYTIKFMHSKKYLDVANGNTENGTNVWQCTGNGSDAQKWKIISTSDGYYQIISKCSNTYLTVANGNDNNCSNIEINSNKNDNSQKFKLNKYNSIKGEKTVDDGIYDIELSNSGKVLEVAEAARFSGANVQIFSRNNAKCQSIEVKYLGDGYYALKFRHSERYLDVANGTTTNGTNVWQCTGNNSDAQKWIIKQTDDGYYKIISKCSETYLTVANGRTINGANIEINTEKNDASQKFKLRKKEIIRGQQTIADGSYQIEVGVDLNKVLEVREAYTYSGANVQIFGKNNSLCQTVDIKYLGDGYYTIRFKHSGMYLDVANGSTANGTNVWQCTGNNSDAQKWIIKQMDDGYYQIISKCSESYLTVAGGKNFNCTNIEINTNVNNKSQKFKFKTSRVLNGIDVSKHQGEIDWEKVKNSNVDFAIIRCGFGENRETQDDSMYFRNVSECERLGIPYGIYIYSYALNEQSARSEVEHVLRLVHNRKPAYGIWFDMEDGDGYKQRNGMPNNETLINICTTFCDGIKSVGHKVGIYASTNWLYEKLNNDSRLDQYGKWIAQWGSKCTYNKPFEMWQYTNKGIVDGIKGFVDMNKYM